MARTLKPQRARAHTLKDVCSPSKVPTHKDLWSKAENALLGLLDVEIDNSTMDLHFMCPKSAVLIIRLDLVRGTAHKKVERVLQRVMDALGVLCVLAEEVYGNSEAFWTRVLASDMLICPPWEADTQHAQIREVASFTQAHGLHLVVRWQDRAFQPYAADAIGVFLRSPRRRFIAGHSNEDMTRLVRISLQFVDCKLAPYDLVHVMGALETPQLTSESDWQDVPLCGVYVLESLEFHGVALGVTSLNALSAGLASPHTRRIDGLSLGSAIVLARSPKYIPAFKRLLVVALQSKHTDAGSACAGLKLSLAKNDLIQPVHIEALQEALASATRPLSALSVAGIPGGDVGTWLRLGRIFFTPSRLPIDGGCELDISNILREQEAVDTLTLSLANIVGEMLPRVTAALLASVDVYCRVTGSHEEYQAVSVRVSGQSLSGWILISKPSDEGSSTWVSSSSISTLRIGDEDVVRSRFTSLVTNATVHQGANNDAILSLTNLMGYGFVQLSAGRRDSFHLVLRDVMDACPNVQILSLPGTNVNEYSRNGAAWAWTEHHRSIKAICLNGSYLSSANLANLLSRLADSHIQTLQYLDLRVCVRLDVESLDMLLMLLQSNTGLACVDIDSSLIGDKTPETSELRSRLQGIDDVLHAEYLSPRIKMGFFSVVRRHEAVHLDDSIVHNVFQFTGLPHQRVVRWKKQQPHE